MTTRRRLRLACVPTGRRRRRRRPSKHRPAKHAERSPRRRRVAPTYGAGSESDDANSDEALLGTAPPLPRPQGRVGAARAARVQVYSALAPYAARRRLEDISEDEYEAEEEAEAGGAAPLDDEQPAAHGGRRGSVTAVQGPPWKCALCPKARRSIANTATSSAGLPDRRRRRPCRSMQLTVLRDWAATQVLLLNVPAVELHAASKVRNPCPRRRGERRQRLALCRLARVGRRACSQL